MSDPTGVLFPAEKAILPDRDATAEIEEKIEKAYPLSLLTPEGKGDVEEEEEEEESGERHEAPNVTFTSGYEHARYLAKREREAVFDTLQEQFDCIYGEVPLSSLRTLLGILNPPPGSTFFDLGSGRGQVVLAAAMFHSFSRVVGIELLSPLHDLSNAVKKNLIDTYGEREVFGDTKVSFVCGDILKEEAYPSDSWSGMGVPKTKTKKRELGEADIVFALSTAFGVDLMEGLGSRAENLKVGAKVVTSSNRISSPLFEVVWEGSLPMSWGSATVFIQEKKHNRKLESVILKSFFRKKR